MTNEILTPPEAMARLKCSRSTLYRLAASGVLRFIPGKPVKFLEADVDLYIRQHLVRKTPPPPLAQPRPEEDPVRKPKRRGGPRPLRLLPPKDPAVVAAQKAKEKEARLRRAAMRKGAG
jgi:excisionase family DNA binding protein